MSVKRPYSNSLECEIGNLRERILNDPIQVLDPPDQHHEFANGDHGRKLDFDRITTGSDFFWQWVSAYTNWVNEVYRGQHPDVLVGVANGANRLATTMSASVGTVALETYKKDKKTVGLNNMARIAIDELNPRFALIIEDVGTTGGTTSTVVPQLREMGVERIEVAHTWIRKPGLIELNRLDVPYSAMIHEPLPTFAESECHTLTNGFCNQGVILIPHGQ